MSQRRQAYGTQGTGNYDSVETDYDFAGRPSKVTVPYQAGAGGTSSGSGATTVYDALNRPTQVTDAGGGWTKYVYTQNDVSVEVGPAVTSPATENTKKRQLQYDALGRLTSVCELTTGSGSGTCSQTATKTGIGQPTHTMSWTDSRESSRTLRPPTRPAPTNMTGSAE